jgi:hypothetical protein
MCTEEQKDKPRIYIPDSLFPLEESRRDGYSIEIPALGVVLPPHNEEEKKEYDKQAGTRK